MKCQRLNSDGIRCNRKAMYAEQYHGYEGIYAQTLTTWVMVFLCSHHITRDLESEDPPKRLLNEDNI